MRQCVVRADRDTRSEDGGNVDAADVAVPPARLVQRLNVDVPATNEQIVGKDHSGERSGDVAEMDDPVLGVGDEIGEAGECDRHRRDESACPEAPEQRHGVHERETGRVDIRHVRSE